MRDRIRFYLNGKKAEASGDDVFLTVAEFLRRRQNLTGTKIVCAEGDCGSCAALIGRIDGDAIRYSAVTSCIQLMLQMDAAHIVTVEGLADGTQLNPIQQAMVACHGSQCGFCTPGFVVAMQGVLNDRSPVDAEAIRRGLTGNLCRCTGYDSIVRAALATDRTALKSIDQMYPPSNMRADLKGWAGEEVRLETSSRRFYKPVTIQQATQYKNNHPGCTVIAGATDLGVVYNKRLREINNALSLSGIPALKSVRVEKDALQIGSGATLSSFQSLTLQHLPELGRFMEWFGSPLIRNAGTLGGNIVTGSPIGDTIPPLIALGAAIECTGIAAARWVPIADFYSGYRKTVLGADELVTSVRLPLLGTGESIKLYKVSRRRDLDISTFGAAIWMRQSQGVIDDVRLAFGGVGPMVLRLPKTEAFLTKQPPTLEVFERAGEIARAEVSPISDVRGSMEYRQTLARNILRKFWYDMLGGDSFVEADLPLNNLTRSPSPGTPGEGRGEGDFEDQAALLRKKKSPSP
jgi:xanthine dehydrogenase small subunit